MTAAYVARLKALVGGLDYIDKNFDAIVLDLVKDHEDEIIAMNVDDQLFQGINSKGQRITPPYSKGYARRRERRGLPTDRITTRFEGDYHKSFFVKYHTDAFELDATDEKKKYLEKRYSEDLYGLTDVNKKRVGNLLLPELVDFINKKLNLS